MKINVSRINKKVHFEAKNEEGNVISMDGAEKIGGENLGVRPMQMLLMALGGCSGIDVVTILQKQKQEADTFDIEIDGDREQGVEPSLYKTIHANFKFTGNLDKVKTHRAVQLSMDKYCSVAKTLEKTANITWSIEINGEKIIVP